jgi:hypothetical protein
MQTYPFMPQAAGNVVPFAFEPVIDRQTFAGLVTWNVAGQRWYITLMDEDGIVILHLALTGSPVGQGIETLTWENGFAMGRLVVPSAFRIGDTRELVVSDCTPAGFNGRHRVLLTGPQSFMYPMAVNPGLVTRVGTISFDLDLLGGYGYEAEMVYRYANQRFEVTP